MRVAYLITAYNDVEMLNTLLGRIVDHGGRAFVHIDLKNIHIRRDALEHENVTYLENPMPVYWGSADLIEVGIRLLETALSRGEFDYLHWLSGSDLPVRPLAEFERYLAGIHPRSIHPARPLDMTRYEHRKRIAAPYFLTERTRAGQVAQTLAFLWGAYVAPRRPIDDSPLQFGSSWLTVTAETARGLIGKWREPAVNAFYRRTYCAEEIFFPTYTAVCAGEAGLCHDRIRFVTWLGGARPKTLTMEDAEEIAASGCFFARKFDSTASRDLVRHLLR